MFFPEGGPEYLTSAKGGQNFFAHAEEGTRIFLRMPRGDQKKLATRDHKQTAPLPVKNDSSLIGSFVYGQFVPSGWRVEHSMK